MIYAKKEAECRGGWKGWGKPAFFGQERPLWV